ncbi:hypothetical protein CPK_ORF01079 [Chlamydia pneumoniae LPCoLN]|uniref:Uncharacterized protein n=1 Tax=Chlamydia pneumoniae TaxID=83558 RepID=A0A0F7XQN5_CHLPN|nr:hypothetical protein CPK_ORF01079 [Chlamydia pneumoniae LPCoLN]ETR80475.1 hypothetical protein X556_0205 [Chlamydia pneumoniae B21]CRI33076.1 Uncharacterized protein BN1224_Wien1_A_05830 [Chlamydia pneumoniae]CRI35939.1 Uncharacterized protein BN1224_CM1_A_05860 [Chlamydia pneumoniae]CRI37066.1 Uncharacterized protein BN1224_CV14_A_05850 [Chlamydia pneumoniae]
MKKKSSNEEEPSTFKESSLFCIFYKILFLIFLKSLSQKGQIQ